jgi:hypothetical protein
MSRPIVFGSFCALLLSTLGIAPCRAGELLKDPGLDVVRCPVAQVVLTLEDLKTDRTVEIRSRVVRTVPGYGRSGPVYQNQTRPEPARRNTLTASIEVPSTSSKEQIEGSTTDELGSPVPPLAKAVSKWVKSHRKLLKK